MAPADVSGLGGRGLRAAASAGCCAARHVGGAVVAQIRLLCSAAGIGICQAQRRAFSFTDFLAAVIANEDCLASQVNPSYFDKTKRRS